MAAALSGHVEERAGLLERTAARPARRHDDVVGQQGELEELPAVQGETHDLFVPDYVEDFTRRRLQERRRAGHRHGLGHAPDAQRERGVHALTEGEDEVLLDRAPETRQVHRQLVPAHRQPGQQEPSASVRDALDLEPAGQVLGDDRSARQHTALFVADDASDFSGVGLAPCRDRSPDQRDQARGCTGPQQ